MVEDDQEEIDNLKNIYSIIANTKKEELFMDKKEKKDNVTLYGENVCTEFEWLPLDKQKENAKKFDNITKNKKNKKST